MKNLADIINKVHCADCLDFMRDMPDGCVDCVVTSPPYFGLRDYGVDGQIGLEPTIAEYISRLVDVFGECRRVLKKTGTMWINISDSYNAGRNGGHPGGKAQWKDGRYIGQSGVNDPNTQAKSLCQIPERLSLALTDELGLIKRNAIIWYKRNCMPSSVSDRFTVDFEYLYFFTKSKNYWFEQQFDNTVSEHPSGNGFIRPHRIITGGRGNPDSWEPTLNRNKRTVWDIPTESFGEAHFAVFPRALVYTPIKAGCPAGGIVLDPFAGSGTTCLEAKEQDKNYIGIEINPEYCKIAEERLKQQVLPFNQPKPEAQSPGDLFQEGTNS